MKKAIELGCGKVATVIGSTGHWIGIITGTGSKKHIIPLSFRSITCRLIHF